MAILDDAKDLDVREYGKKLNEASVLRHKENYGKGLVGEKLHRHKLED